eukprot:7383559-Prorocentrum_lima.AAC.1
MAKIMVMRAMGVRVRRVCAALECCCCSSCSSCGRCWCCASAMHSWSVTFIPLCRACVLMWLAFVHARR